MAYGKQNDLHLCNRIPKLTKVFPDKIPNLIRQCNATTADKSYQLYTADTCAEFHWLMCELLKSFQTTLEKLDSTFSHLFVVAFWGHSLWSLARSGAVENHMKSIEPQLSSMKTKNDGGTGDGGGTDEGERDEELEGLLHQQSTH
jgi:hypothetical protein